MTLSMAWKILSQIHLSICLAVPQTWYFTCELFHDLVLSRLSHSTMYSVKYNEFDWTTGTSAARCWPTATRASRRRVPIELCLYCCRCSDSWIPIDWNVNKKWLKERFYRNKDVWPLFKGSQNYVLGLIIYITCRQLWIRWNSLPLVKFQRFWVLFS